MLDDIDTREKVAHPSYKEKEQLDFQILLTDNCYVNPANIHICFPIKIKKIFSTFSPWDVYQYSDQMLKHLPKDSLKSIEKTHLYSKLPIYFASTLYDRRNHNSANVVLTGLTTAKQTERKQKHAKDLNIDQRIELFQAQLKNEFVYRIPLRYFSDTGKINFPTKIDYRIKMFLETNMDKLFELRKVLTANAEIPKVDAEIIFTKAPYIQYEQILLDKNFRQHLETIMVSKKI